MLPLPNWNAPTANVPPIQQQQQNRFPNQQHFNQNQQQRNFIPQQNQFGQPVFFNPNQQQRVNQPHFNPNNQQQRNFNPQQRQFNPNFIPQQQNINFMNSPNSQLPTSFGPQNPGKRQYNNNGKNGNNNNNYNDNNRGNKRGRGNFRGGGRGGHNNNSGGGALFKDDFLQDPWTKLLNQQTGQENNGKNVDSKAVNEQESTLSNSSQISDSNNATNHEEINIDSDGDDNVNSYDEENNNNNNNGEQKEENLAETQ